MRSLARWVLLSMSFVLWACQGARGEQGPEGPPGPQGPPGPAPTVATGAGLVGDGSTGMPLSIGAIDQLRFSAVAPSTTGILPSGPRVDLLRFLRYSNAPVFDVGSLAWENSGVYNPWVIRDGAQYKMYYAGSGANWQIGVATATANPPPGTDWFAPGQWQRHASNPVVTIGGWAGTWVLDPCVIKVQDPADPRPYKMWFAGNGSGQGIGFASSADGLSWTPSASNPVVARTLTAEQNQIRWPSVIHDPTSSVPYRMWYSCHDTGYWRVCYATSLDGLTWTKPQVNPVDTGGYRNVVVSRLYDNGGWNHAQAPSVAKVGAYYYMTLGRGGATWQTNLLMSRDGIAWTTVGRLLRSEDADWWFDSSISERANLVLDGDRAYVFYSANRARWTIGTAIADFTR